jgi:hypothetical protein
MGVIVGFLVIVHSLIETFKNWNGPPELRFLERQLQDHGKIQTQLLQTTTSLLTRIATKLGV